MPGVSLLSENPLDFRWTSHPWPIQIQSGGLLSRKGEGHPPSKSTEFCKNFENAVVNYSIKINYSDTLCYIYLFTYPFRPMSPHLDAIRMRLSGGPSSSRQLFESIGVSQPTLSRALAKLGDEVLRIGSARSIHYTLRDSSRGLPDIPVYRVDAEGRVRQLGVLVPVKPDGFVMRQANGIALHSDGLPWWLSDMCPQGYLGRAYAARHGAGLGLPERLANWSDTHALRALLAHGHDGLGNLLLGELARNLFLAAPLPEPVAVGEKAERYARLALDAARGELPGSSAGGEQPKFATYAMTSSGARHVLVKFSEREPSPVSERWRDLLLAEHFALDTLREAGIPAAKTQLLAPIGQSFLEVERFDRIGPQGRRALISLGAMDAEFVGIGAGVWPDMVRRLAVDGHILSEAYTGACLLWAFGTLIGNSDMHSGNLSFVSEHGRPYALAPAYDMTPMAFAPRSGGGLPDTLPEANIRACVGNETWQRGEALARLFLARVVEASGFSQRFEPCVAALVCHIETAHLKIKRLV